MISEKSISAAEVASGPTKSEPNFYHEVPSRDYHLDIFPVTQFHCHIHCIRDDGNITEHLKASNNFGCCGAARQGDRLTLADEFSRGKAYETLLLGKTAHLVLKRTVGPKWLEE